MVIALMASTLHRARERTLDEETLEEEGDQHGGKNGQYACREHRAVFIELRLAKEAGDHDRDRLGLRVEVRINANRNSFQLARKQKMMAATMPGRTTGTSTRVIIPNHEHPSISAARSRLIGTPSK